MSIREKNNLQVRYAFPAYRVYIFGIDVTNDVLDVNVQYNVGRAPNTCTVTLANELDKYILTLDDFEAIFKNKLNVAPISTYMEQDTGNDPDYLLKEVINATDQKILERVTEIKSEIKREILKAKVNVRVPNVEQPDIAGKYGLTNVRQYTATAYRYPFQAEDPIFHPNDPMRVFMRDPFNPNKWYHMFCGFLSNFDDNVDENNQRILTITAEGPSKILRYARISTNPGIVDINAIKEMEDLVNRSMFSEGFSGLSLPELLFTIIFGNDPKSENGKFSLKYTSVKNETIKRARLYGVGNFNYGQSIVIQYGDDKEDPLTLNGINFANVNSLSIYQSLIDHEVKETDLLEMVLDTEEARISVASDKQNLPKNGNNITIEAIMKYIGTQPDLYPVDGGRLILLIPRSFHPEINREILLKDVLRSVGMTTQFQSRLGVIYNVIERIEFVFYESPKGDLICEFPLYDFDPNDFGTEEVPHFTVDRFGLSEVSNVTRGPFAPRYIIDKRDTYNFSKSITDEKIRTQIASAWHYLQNYPGENASSKEIQAPAVVTLRHLVPLYWLRLEEVDPKGYLASKEAALLYAHILLNKTNADARNLGINAVPNITLGLNRPIYFKPRNCIGILMGLGHNIKWGMGGSMDTRLNLNYIRGWDGLIDNKGNKVFTSIGGIPSRPLDYKVLFKLKNVNKGAEDLPSDGESQGPDTSGII